VNRKQAAREDLFSFFFESQLWGGENLKGVSLEISLTGIDL